MCGKVPIYIAFGNYLCLTVHYLMSSRSQKRLNELSIHLISVLKCKLHCKKEGPLNDYQMSGNLVLAAVPALHTVQGLYTALYSESKIFQWIRMLSLHLC